MITTNSVITSDVVNWRFEENMVFEPFCNFKYIINKYFFALSRFEIFNGLIPFLKSLAYAGFFSVIICIHVFISLQIIALVSISLSITTTTKDGSFYVVIIVVSK